MNSYVKKRCKLAGGCSQQFSWAHNLVLLPGNSDDMHTLFVGSLLRNLTEMFTFLDMISQIGQVTLSYIQI
jgi:hypothetical protein